MALEYSWADPDDLPAIETFLSRRYGPDSVQAVPGRARWFGLEHPGGLHVCLCHDRGELIALCFHLPVTVALGERRIRAGYGFDFLVADSHRRRGIGTRMLEMRLERFELSLSTGQSASMSSLYRQSGALRLAPFTRAVFVRRIVGGGGPRRWLRRIWASGLRLRRPSVAGEREELDMTAATDLLASLETASQRRAGTLTDGDRLRWRYGGTVYTDYRLYALLTAAGQRGLLVSRREGERELLSDLFCAEEERAALLNLAGHTSGGASLVALTCGPGLADALGRAGWLVRPTAAELVAMSADSALLAELKSSAWCSFAGDADADLLRQP